MNTKVIGLYFENKFVLHHLNSNFKGQEKSCQDDSHSFKPSFRKPNGIKLGTLI
jgi:hypothetical protein